MLTSALGLVVIVVCAQCGNTAHFGRGEKGSVQRFPNSEIDGTVVHGVPPTTKVKVAILSSPSLFQFCLRCPPPQHKLQNKLPKKEARHFEPCLPGQPSFVLFSLSLSLSLSRARARVFFPLSINTGQI